MITGTQTEITNGDAGLDVAPTARVNDYTTRFATFLNEEVVPAEVELAKQGAGTPDRPTKDEHGWMHPAVWEARRHVQRAAGTAGLYAPHLAATEGGAGFSRVEMQHVEEFVYYSSGLGLGLAALAWTEGPYPASAWMSDAARVAYLAPLVRGELTAAFANTEPGVGSDMLSQSARATRDGNDWILRGRKGWITNAPYCDVAYVVAVTQPGAGTRSLSMFLVDASMPGFSRGPVNETILDDGLTGELVFEEVRVPAENVVGEIGDGFALAMQNINWRRLCRAGMDAGWGRWLLDRAVDYTTRRPSGTGTMADHQTVQHTLARMDLDVTTARAASLVLQARIDQLGAFALPLDREVPRLVSLVKVLNDEAFYRVADNAVQVHGAAGLRLGSPEEKLFRLARNLRIPAGATEIQLNAVARDLLRSTAAV